MPPPIDKIIITKKSVPDSQENLTKSEPIVDSAKSTQKSNRKLLPINKCGLEVANLNGSTRFSNVGGLILPAKTINPPNIDRCYGKPRLLPVVTPLERITELAKSIKEVESLTPGSKLERPNETMVQQAIYNVATEPSDSKPYSKVGRRIEAIRLLSDKINEQLKLNLTSFNPVNEDMSLFDFKVGVITDS